MPSMQTMTVDEHREASDLCTYAGEALNIYCTSDMAAISPAVTYQLDSNLCICEAAKCLICWINAVILLYQDTINGNVNGKVA